MPLISVLIIHNVSPINHCYCFHPMSNHNIQSKEYYSISPSVSFATVQLCNLSHQKLQMTTNRWFSLRTQQIHFHASGDFLCLYPTLAQDHPDNFLVVVHSCGSQLPSTLYLPGIHPPGLVNTGQLVLSNLTLHPRLEGFC